MPNSIWVLFIKKTSIFKQGEVVNCEPKQLSSNAYPKYHDETTYKTDAYPKYHDEITYKKTDTYPKYLSFRTLRTNEGRLRHLDVVQCFFLSR